MNRFADTSSSIQPNQIRFLHIFSLVAIGIAHPLQDQLASNPEFFVVKHSGATDIIALTILLCLVMPLLLIGLILLIGFIHPKAKKPAYFSVMFLLLLIMASTALNRAVQTSAFLHIAVSVAAASLILYGYLRFQSIRSTFPFLCIAVLLVPVFFFGKSSIRKFLLPPKTVSETLPQISSSVPIIMVLWDEFPLVSLLDQQNQIDAKLYPNLSTLSKHSFWFTNASTISPWTGTSVTAILSGNYPRSDSLPTFYDHPKNLFTMLKGSYDFEVIERQTRLCPTEMCHDQWTRPGFFLRMRATLQDASAVLLHIVLPLAFEDSLPNISKDWSDFWAREEDRPKEFQKFLDSIDESKKPTLFFIHSGLPHTPWTHLPSENVQEYVSEFINAKETGTLANFRSHLLQISYVDELIGKLLEKLHRTGLYDRSLIVITADHGISISRNKIERIATEDNYRDLMLIPLFIKVPYQKSGERIERNVETVDIVPTIAQVLNANTGWSDGSSALDLTRPERDHKMLFSGNKIMRMNAHLSLNNTLKKELLP